MYAKVKRIFPKEDIAKVGCPVKLDTFFVPFTLDTELQRISGKRMKELVALRDFILVPGCDNACVTELDKVREFVRDKILSGVDEDIDSDDDLDEILPVPDFLKKKPKKAWNLYIIVTL